MFETIFFLFYAWVSYTIVKKFRPATFTTSEPTKMETDIAMVAIGAFTVAPIVVLGYMLVQLIKLVHTVNAKRC